MTYLVLGLLFSHSVPRFSVLRTSLHFGGRAIIRPFRWLGISPNVREIVIKDFFAARPPYCYGLERTDRTVGEHINEPCKGYLDKVLIVPSAHARLLLPERVFPHN